MEIVGFWIFCCHNKLKWNWDVLKFHSKYSIIYTQLKDCWQRSPYVGKDFPELTALMNQRRKKKKT